MPTVRLSGQAWDDLLITPYMVMGLMSQVRGQRTACKQLILGTATSKHKHKPLHPLLVFTGSGNKRDLLNEFLSSLSQYPFNVNIKN